MLIYIIKSMVCLSVLFGLYKLLLGRTTYFRANHLTLIAITVLSVIAPFIEIPVENEVIVVGYIDDVMIDAGYVDLQPTTTTRNPLTWQNILTLIYIIGVSFCLINSVVTALKTILFIRRTPAHAKTDRYTLLITDDERVAPCSLGRYVIMSRTDYEQSGEAILAHELCHVSHLHTLSVMLMNLLSSLLWMNPIVWMVREELLLNCEYEADTAVIRKGVDTKQYQLLLIKKAVGQSRFAAASSLHHSSLKKRIAMMKRTKSSPWSVIRYGVVSLSAAVVLPSFAQKYVMPTLLSEHFMEETRAIQERLFSQLYSGKGIDSVLVDNSADLSAAEEEVFEVVDEMPQFDGGETGLLTFISNTMKYPEQAVKDKIEGRVIVKFTVLRSGAITDIAILRSKSKELDQEVYRVVKMTSGHWLPGKINGKAVNSRYALPITFRLP